MLFHNAIFLFFNGKKIHFWTKYITKFLTTSQEILFCQKISNESESNAISTVDIVVGGDHDQGKFQSVCKFILRDVNGKIWIRM